MDKTSLRKKKSDLVPHIPAAGTQTNKTENVKECFTDTVWGESNSTPRNLKKYRTELEPGKSLKHWGSYDDDVDRSKRYGDENMPDDYIDTVIFPEKSNAILEHESKKMKEKIYDSVRKEPLGKVPEDSKHIPQSVKQDEHVTFGIETPESFHTGETIHSFEPWTEWDKKFEPGQRSTIKMPWNDTKIDPESFRFGKTVKKPEDVRDCIQPHKGKKPNESNKIVNKTQAEFLKANEVPLGRSRNLGFGKPDHNTDEPFGKKNKPDEYGAWATIRSEPKEETDYDRTLGRSIQQTKISGVPVDESKPMGAPTVRLDKNPPKNKSLSDATNYGDEPDVYRCISPARFSSLGVFEDDFGKPLSEDQLKELFVDNSLMTQEEFNKLFEIAQNEYLVYYRGEQGVSIQSMIKAWENEQNK
eukprot:gb/GECH01012712.1/.p1 GENE.gb/GECH01012712.1/~~gb/GECH01012712.1/.p1  ORF type:complete len:415 (+),score=96.00 gb/GECH01012712.1/:1-1245(+)